MKGGNQLNDNVDMYFKSYNLITWSINKKYIIEEMNELNDFCKSQDFKLLPNCDTIESTSIECCNWKNKKPITKDSINIFNTKSIINIDNKKLTF